MPTSPRPSQTPDQPDDQQRCASGIPGLDDILMGGFPVHRFFLIQGEPGVGKTTLALQFLLSGSDLGEDCLYITLSETRVELDGVARSHGWDLAGLHVLDLSTIEDQILDDAQTTMFHPSEIELNRTTKTILEHVARIKPARVVFDSMSEMRLLAETSLRFRRQMLALKQYFINIKATVLFLDDNTSEEPDRNMQSLVHGVITLESMPPEFGIERRRLRVVKIRGSACRGGFHDFLIARGGMRVFPRLIAAEHHREFDEIPSSSGLPPLDELLKGGLDRGTSNLLIGPAGTGKSTFATAFAAAAAQRGEHVVVYAFDENQKTWRKRSDGLDLRVGEHLAAGRIRIQQLDPAEVAPGQFTSMVRDDVERHHARMIVLDSLNGYLNAMPEIRVLALQLHEMLSYLNQQGVITVMTLAQHGLVGTMDSPIDVTYIADTVLVLRYFEALGEVKRAVSVIKKRSGGHERTIREYHLGDSGLTIGAPIHEFQGVLSGTPFFHGGSGSMIPSASDDESRRSR